MFTEPALLLGSLTTIDMRILLLPTLLLFLLASGCDSDPASVDEIPEPELMLVEDLPADPFVAFVEGRPVGTGRFTFFSLRENRIVPAADSASTEWDLALQGSLLLTNGGTSGPGNGGAQVYEGIFEEVTEAPASGYAVDAEGTPAITPGSGNGWYNYDFATNLLTPIPGRVLLIRTADGKYVKLRILSYYKGAPATPDADSEGRYFTFEYLYQPDGSRTFE